MKPINMSINQIREKIINEIKEAVINLPFVYAGWLEGSDGLNTVDEFSDIDIVIDVEDEYVSKTFEIIENVLSSISKIDYIHQVDCGNPKIIQKYYHLENTSEFLIIDFAIQLHSRDANEWGFIKDSKVEAPAVLFDKNNVVRFKESDKNKIAQIKTERIQEIRKMYDQKSRVIKYCKRGLYIEAFGYFHKYVVAPLVEMLRLKYTPEHHYYYIVHISNNFPPNIVQRLETFFKVATVEEIYEKTVEAGDWLKELEETMN